MVAIIYFYTNLCDLMLVNFGFFFFFFWGTVNFRFNWLKCFYYYASTNTSATIIFLKCWHGKVYILCQKVFGQIGNVYLRIFLVAERNNHYNKKTTKI